MTQNSVAVKTTKPWYMKWWIWAIAALVLIGGIVTAVTPKEMVQIPDVAGTPASEAEAALKDLGFKVTLKNGDKTVFNGSDWDAESTDPESEAAEGSRVILYVVEATERLAAEAEAAEAEKMQREAEKASAPLGAVEAQVLCDRYAEAEFPFGVKMHWIVGKLAEEQTDTGWYMKVEATVTNMYDAEQKINVECHMSGTNSAPVMDSFIYY